MGWSTWLVALSERDPVVLLVEDLHWCDPSSLELLGRVVERIATERVLLVTTSRPEFVPAWATLDHVHNVSIDRVTELEATDLVNAMLARSEVDDGVRRRIVEHADGNPLFLEELSQMVLEASDHATTLESAALEIPSTLQSSLLARLDRLGEAKAFAQVAAVIGREFSRKMVQLVIMDAQIGLDDDALDDAFVQLTDTGLVVRTRHNLRPTPSSMHSCRMPRVTHCCERPEATSTAASCTSCAITFRTGSPHSPNSRHATPRRAAWSTTRSRGTSKRHEQARSRSEHEEALLHLQRALDLLVTQAESIERDQREIALQQTLAVELFVARGYSVPEAIAALERVRELAQSCDDTRSHAGAVIGLGLAAYTSTDFERGEEFVVEGFVIAERAGAVAHMVAALGTYALTVFFQGRFREGHEAAERAVALYEPAQHHRGTGRHCR